MARRSGRRRLKAAARPEPSHGNGLRGVAATSARNAWAVGETDTLADDLTVILHWSGTRWARAASPNPGASNMCRPETRLCC